MLQERVQRLEAQEAHFAESLVALQFQKVARAAETLSVYTTLLSIQELLLGQLSEAETLTKSACAQILESHSPVSGVAGWGAAPTPPCAAWSFVWNGIGFYHLSCM